VAASGSVPRRAATGLRVRYHARVKKPASIIVGCALTVALTACGGDTGVTLSGATMGTVYHVRAFCAERVPDLTTRVERDLNRISADMSTWDPDSTLSRFNRGPIGEWFEVSSDLAQVVQTSQDLATRSGGAFDITVGPLVDLWGFGADDAARERAGPPDPAEIEAARARVGYSYLDVRESPPALRRRRDLRVDVAAIAPGYAVDLLSRELTAAGCGDHMVEIGGEVYARGRKSDGSAWRIGIETPDPAQPPGSSITRVVLLEDRAAATSGDYRDFIEWQGERYSHSFDPRTGTPVDHTLAAVTVLHASTLWADGLATLLYVLGPTAGLEFARAQGLAALFIERTDSGFVETMTPEFQQSLEDKPK